MLQPFTEGKAVVQLVLPPSWVARINQLAMERGINRSALIRAAIQTTYFHEMSDESGTTSQGTTGYSSDSSEGDMHGAEVAESPEATCDGEGR